MFVMEYIDQYPIQIIIALLVLAVIIIVIGQTYGKELQDRMNLPYIRVPAFDLDAWSITHFMLFMTLGFIKPDYPLSFLMVGIGWEIVEDALAADKNTQLADCLSNKEGLYKKIMCNGSQDGYWIANLDDLLCNMVGYLIGSAIRTSMVGYDISVAIVKK